MAKIIYELKVNQNTKSTAYGKHFAQVKNLETMNTRKLAQHISEHGSIYTPDVVYGVLEKFRACLIEMLLESKKVKIDGLGTFYCTLENQPGGAQKKEDFNVGKHLKALHIRFLPEQATELNISSREFLKKAEFINIDSLLKGTEDADAPEVTPSDGKFEVKLNANPSVGGSVSGAGRYPAGQAVEISASPAEGYQFTRWSDGDTNASRSLTLRSNTVLTAYFKSDSDTGEQNPGGGLEG